MSKKLLLFPFGGNAKESLLSIFAINEIKHEWDVVGFLDDEKSLHNKDYYGVKVLGGRDVLANHPDAFVLAVPGSPKGYLKRKSIIESLSVEKSRFATIIHPSVVKAPDTTIGYNTLLMPHVVVSCAVRIGNHCIVLPNSVIAHDSAVGHYCCIGSNVSISGSVSIGEECYIGSGVKVREHVCIGSRSLIGLGSNVIADIGEGIIAVGNPARAMRKKSLASFHV
jgi:sugar O-acyltransferase (sialic acid O-acetyltransferase NeuD family)